MASFSLKKKGASPEIIHVKYREEEESEMSTKAITTTMEVKVKKKSPTRSQERTLMMKMTRTMINFDRINSRL